MNLERVKPIVDAVLYEGYILYPYRAATAKNRQRWTFGGIYPRRYWQATGGAEPCHMQTQCLVEGSADTRLEIRVRFLQPVARGVGKLARPLASWDHDRPPAFENVASLTVGDKSYHAWQEAIERDVAVADCDLGGLRARGQTVTFAFSGGRQIEPITGDDGAIYGVLARERAAIRGQVELFVELVEKPLHRLTVRIENHTPVDPAQLADRQHASLYSLASTHTIFGVAGGAFVSLMDPGDGYRQAAAACDNQGAYPILAGTPGARDMLLSSPIILYDYPEVAPESPGDAFDATEIDEILSLNILAMTDAEKREMAATDARAAALLARTQALSADDFMRLHGVLRQPRPAPASAGRGADHPLEPASGTGRDEPFLACYGDGATPVKVGDRVRLRLNAGGDVWDLVLDGKTAVIEGIERDFENRVHVAVAIDDDPGRDWGFARMPGHRFFFSPEEIEPLEPRP